MFEKFRIIITRLFAITLSIVILVSSSATGEAWPLAGETLFCMGIFLASIASMGRLWCSVYIAGYKTDRLITQGPYSLCRNPLYFFSLIGAIGVGLATKTVLIPTLILFAFTFYYPFVIKSEESVLSQRHGAAFHTYTQTVPRFWPRLSGLEEPDTYVVKPKVYKRHMVDALWFVWIAGFLEFVGSLHETQILPAIFKIY